MNRFIFAGSVAMAMAVATVQLQAAPYVDTIQAPAGYFAPGESATFDSPYYRTNGQGWSWNHNAIGGTFTSATLQISAFDVDFNAPGYAGERDEIFAKKGGVWTSLGFLQGANDVYAYTDFNLDASFFPDIAAGLQIMMTIDLNNEGWYVTLGKSVLSLDGGVAPPPNPGEVPLPFAMAMFPVGLGVIGWAARRRRKDQPATA